MSEPSLRDHVYRTVASAVILPDEPSPPGHKRRPSSASASDFKRRRLSDDTHHFVGTKNEDSNHVERAGQRRATGQAEERKRGKRLFGALLGTLSQNSSSSIAQQRRAEIERKQQTKLKRQAEEYDAKKKDDKEKFLASRRLEQKKFDEQSMRIRHSNMLAMAHSLYTTTEPRLYYKPWKLSSSEDARIVAQVEQAKATIDRELQDFADRQRNHQIPNEQPNQANVATIEQPMNPDDTTEHQRSPDKSAEETKGHLDHEDNADHVATLQQAVPLSEPKMTSIATNTASITTDNETTNTAAKTNIHPSMANNEPSQTVLDGHAHIHLDNGNGETADGDGGEVMVEAEEDTVIY